MHLHLLTLDISHFKCCVSSFKKKKSIVSAYNLMFLPIYSSDAGGGRHSGSGKDSKNNQVLEKAMAPSLPTFQEPKCKEVTAAR